MGTPGEIERAPGQTPLFAKEAEERNNWDRTICQIYFSWYTFFFTFNGAALTWVFGYDGLNKPGIKIVLVLFALWSSFGAVATVFMIRRVVESNRRLGVILALLSEGGCEAQSPIPKVLLILAFCLTGATLVTLVGLWIHLSSSAH